MDLSGNPVAIYVRMTKPAVWGALVLTGILGFVLGSLLLSRFSLSTLVLVTVALVTGTAGCESLTNYIDLPIDSVMRRTHGRPLPAGVLTPAGAVTVGFTFLGIALATSAELGFPFLGLMALGIVDNVVIYSYWLKRKTPQNIIWGGISGAIPILFGAEAADPSATYLNLALFAFVFFWTPPHIWAIAVEYRKDYADAGVPMLPVVSPFKIWGGALTAFSGALMAVSFLALYFVHFSFMPFILIVGLNALLGKFLYDFLSEPDKMAHRLFHYLNLYLASTLLVLIMSAIL